MPSIMEQLQRRGTNSRGQPVVLGHAAHTRKDMFLESGLWSDLCPRVKLDCFLTGAGQLQRVNTISL